MLLQPKTLERLRLLINEETVYRSGPSLVKFFNELGFNDIYPWEGRFSSRQDYSDQRLKKINGAPELDKCVRNLFAPVNFIGQYSKLDSFIAEFNNYLAFDGWIVVRKEQQITFVKAGKIDFEQAIEIKEDDFLNKEFEAISLDKLVLDNSLTDVISIRFEEIKSCLKAKAPMSVIFLAGSSLEGILLGFAAKHPRAFNQSNSSPKDKDGKVKPHHEWSLNSLIETAYEVGLLKEDVKKFSHSLRDFRNYIHPYQQMSSGFNPDEHTAQICWQVLKAAVIQLSTNAIP